MFKSEPNLQIHIHIRLSGAAPPSVNFGPPHISETVRATKLKFYARLDMAKYTFQVWISFG